MPPFEPDCHARVIPPNLLGGAIPLIAFNYRAAASSCENGRVSRSLRCNKWIAPSSPRRAMDRLLSRFHTNEPKLIERILTPTFMLSAREPGFADWPACPWQI